MLERVYHAFCMLLPTYLPVLMSWQTYTAFDQEQGLVQALGQILGRMLTKTGWSRGWLMPSHPQMRSYLTAARHLSCSTRTSLPQRHWEALLQILQASRQPRVTPVIGLDKPRMQLTAGKLAATQQLCLSLLRLRHSTQRQLHGRAPHICTRSMEQSTRDSRLRSSLTTSTGRRSCSRPCGLPRLVGATIGSLDCHDRIVTGLMQGLAHTA